MSCRLQESDVIMGLSAQGSVIGLPEGGDAAERDTVFSQTFPRYMPLICASIACSKCPAACASAFTHAPYQPDQFKSHSCDVGGKAECSTGHHRQPVGGNGRLQEGSESFE